MPPLYGAYAKLREAGVLAAEPHATVTAAAIPSSACFR
jgi:hypothetical protein